MRSKNSRLFKHSIPHNRISNTASERIGLYALYFYVKEPRMKKADITEKRKGFIKKIGNTTYDVSFYYSRQSKESMNDKIIRLIENGKQDMKNN